MNEASPVVSFIIPVYNGERYIEKAVRSIQVFHENLPYEILLIDDGSTDHSFSVCSTLAQDDCRIKVLSKENEGIAATRDFGLQHTQGKFICFFDQDDTCIACVSPFVQLLDHSGSDFLIANYQVQEGEVAHDHILFPDLQIRDTHYAHFLIRALVSSRYLCTEAEQKDVPPYWGTIWNCIYRRSFIQEHQLHVKSFFDYEDDWVFTIECLVHVKKIILSSNSFYSHAIHGSSETFRSKYISKFFEGRELLIRHLVERLRIISLTEEQIQKACNLFLKDTCLWGFYNAMKQCRKQYLVEIKTNYYLYQHFSSIRPYIHSPREYLLLRLIHLRFFSTAYYLNRKVFRLSYH